MNGAIKGVLRPNQVQSSRTLKAAAQLFRRAYRRRGIPEAIDAWMTAGWTKEGLSCLILLRERRSTGRRCEKPRPIPDVPTQCCCGWSMDSHEGVSP